MEDQKKELTLERTFDAPRDLVFKAWTDKELVKKWWGPRGVTNPVCEVDAVPGGKINIVMLAGPELGELAGQEWPMTGKFEEVAEPEKLVYTANAIVDGKEVLTTRNTITFEEQDGKTKMTAHILVTKTTPEAEGPLAGMEMGWDQQLDKLVEFIKAR
ncbi:MAG TPA: SRPBCC domain-containing protein [Candidatus Saccharimonadales bacterium]|nr:SRPBCC domain-containing protein [Candidatus Saccharimonadales bacterium]